MYSHQHNPFTTSCCEQEWDGGFDMAVMTVVKYEQDLHTEVVQLSHFKKRHLSVYFLAACLSV